MDEYRVVEDSTVFGLQYAVNELITEGFEIQGNLVVKDGKYFQTMVRKEKVLNEEEN